LSDEITTIFQLRMLHSAQWWWWWRRRRRWWWWRWYNKVCGRSSNFLLTRIKI